MQINGFALYDPQNNILQQWVTIPNFVNVPGIVQVFGATAGWNFNGYRIAAYSWIDIGAPVQVNLIQLLSLFTQAEQLALAGSADAHVRLFLLKAAAMPVMLNDAQFQTGLNYLVSLGIITAGRAAQILANVVQFT